MLIKNTIIWTWIRKQHIDQTQVGDERRSSTTGWNVGDWTNTDVNNNLLSAITDHLQPSQAHLKFLSRYSCQPMTLSYLFRVDLQQLVHRSPVFLAIELQPKNVRIPLLLGVAVVPGKLMEAQAEQHVLQKKKWRRREINTERTYLQIALWWTKTIWRLLSPWHPSRKLPRGRCRHWQLLVSPFGESPELVYRSPQERKRTCLWNQGRIKQIWHLGNLEFLNREKSQALTHNKAECDMCGGTGVGSVWAQESSWQWCWSFCTPPRGSARAPLDGSTSLSE